MSDRRRPWWVWGCADDLTARDISNLRRFNVAALLWAAVLIAGVLTVRKSGLPALAVAAIVTLETGATLIVGSLWLRFLREADELTRKLQLHAMAMAFLVGLGAALLQPLSLAALERADGSRWLAEILEFLEPGTIMPFTYIVALVRAQRRVRG